MLIAIRIRPCLSSICVRKRISAMHFWVRHSKIDRKSGHSSLMKKRQMDRTDFSSDRSKNDRLLRSNPRFRSKIDHRLMCIVPSLFRWRWTRSRLCVANLFIEERSHDLREWPTTTENHCWIPRSVHIRRFIGLDWSSKLSLQCFQIQQPVTPQCKLNEFSSLCIDHSSRSIFSVVIHR